MTSVPLANIKSKFELLLSMVSSEPNYMVLFITAMCNARCPMCFYWKEIAGANAKAELQLEDYEKVTQGLNNLYYLSIGGGEPFIRKDLPKIVELFHKNSRTRVVTVATNGSFPDRVEKYLEHIAGNCPGIQMRIQVSIDNLYDKHDQSRGFKGLFNKVIDTCKVIETAKKKGFPLMFSIGTVLTPANRNDLKDLRLFLDENVAFDDLSLIYPRGNAKDPAFKDVTLEEYNRTKKLFESIHTESGTFARLYQAIDREAKRGIECFLEEGPNGYPWTCVAGEKMITMTEKGFLTPCEMLCQLNPEMDSTIGNVRDFNHNILKMLASDKSRNLRSYIEKTHCSCSYECAALCNVVYHKKQWPRIVKDVLKF